MRPYRETVSIASDQSWTLLNRRLDDEIPFQWHYHPEFELTLTLNSRGQRYIGDHIGRYDDGDLVLLGPNLPHTWCSADRIDPAQPHIALVMWFTPDWARPLTGTLTELKAVEPMLAASGRGLVFSAASAADVRPLVESLPGLDPPSRVIRLIEILSRLARRGEYQPLASPAADAMAAASPDRDRISRVLDHLHAHYREEVTIADLAGIACLSISGFHRLFRRHTSLTVSDYLAQLRIGRACALLINSQLPVAHVADEAGYSNLSHFNRQFRALKGMTPREFRRSFALPARRPGLMAPAA